MSGTDNPVSRRRFLSGAAALAGGALGAPLLSACDASRSPGAGSSGGGGKAVTLTVMYKSNELTKDHIADFQSKNPGITVNFIEYDSTRLNAMLTSGEPPDFVRMPAVGSANKTRAGWPPTSTRTWTRVPCSGRTTCSRSTTVSGGTAGRSG